MIRIAEKLELMTKRAAKVCTKTEIGRVTRSQNPCFCATVYQNPP
jgi:hypothetical protein